MTHATKHDAYEFFQEEIRILELENAEHARFISRHQWDMSNNDARISNLRKRQAAAVEQTARVEA